MDKEIIHKELDLIQDVIKRMASNSFEVKKWLIGILTAIIVFKHDELLGEKGQYIWLLLIPVISFWYLDGFFLGRERFYREVYQWVLQHRGKTDAYLYDLNSSPRVYKLGDRDVTISLETRRTRTWNAMWSATLWHFYIIPALFIIAYGIILFTRPDTPPPVTCHH